MSDKKVKSSTVEETPEEVTPETTEETKEDAELLEGEIERILPGPGEPLQLVDGTFVNVRPLKMRELFAALKILTRGATAAMPYVADSLLGASQGEFAETFIALLINAFPEADVEFCEFVRVVVEPRMPEGGWEGREEREAAERHLDKILEDELEIDDAIDIITLLIHRESKDIQRLGKKVANAAKMFQKVSPKTPKN